MRQVVVQCQSLLAATITAGNHNIERDIKSGCVARAACRSGTAPYIPQSKASTSTGREHTLRLASAHAFVRARE